MSAFIRNLILVSLLIQSLNLDNFVKVVSSLNNTTTGFEDDHILTGSKLPFKPFEVHVVNNLPNNNPPLTIHCASKDDDLGTHALDMTQDFNWKFRVNFILSTMFFCRFKRAPRNTAFEVFNEHIGPDCEASTGNVCLWSVREDGFYLGNGIPPVNLRNILGLIINSSNLCSSGRRRLLDLQIDLITL